MFTPLFPNTKMPFRSMREICVNKRNNHKIVPFLFFFSPFKSEQSSFFWFLFNQGARELFLMRKKRPWNERQVDQLTLMILTVQCLHKWVQNLGKQQADVDQPEVCELNIILKSKKITKQRSQTKKKQCAHETTGKAERTLYYRFVKRLHTIQLHKYVGFEQILCTSHFMLCHTCANSHPGKRKDVFH